MTDENTGVQPPEIPNTVTGEVKTSKSAIWSLVCGILGVILCLPAFPAAILGILALVKINKSNGLLKGTGMAIIGLILAGLWIIAIPFIAIIAAIAIPGLLNARVSANEFSTVASLKTLCSQESIWRELDIDGNGIQDYWTYDVSCFNRMYRSDGVTKVSYIDIGFARADTNRAEDDVFGTFPVIELWSTRSAQPPSAPISGGYYFQAMESDENGNPYNQNKVGSEQKIKATNSTKFAFMAYPADYGSSGINTFIVNETGTIYKKDTRGSKVLEWPGEDSTQQGWQIADHY